MPIKPKTSWHAMVMLALVRLGAGQGIPTSTNPTGAVSIHIADGYGHEISPKDVSKIAVIGTSGKDFAPSSFAGVVQLPFGRYTLRVLVPGFVIWSGELRVSRLQTRVTVGLRGASIEGPALTCSVSGRVIDAGGRKLWVRLMPLFSGEILEADAMPDGRFRVDGADCADYLLVVMGDGGVIRFVTAHLTLAEPQPISVRLEPEP